MTETKGANAFQQFFEKVLHQASNKLWNETPPIGTPLEHFRKESLSDWLGHRSFNEVTRTFLFKDSTGFCLELTPLIGGDDQTNRTISEVLTSSIPPQHCVSILQYSSPKIGAFTDTWVEAQTKGGDLFVQLALQRRKYFRRSVWTSASGSAPFYMRHHRVILSVQREGTSQELSENLAEIRESIMNALVPINVQSTVWSPRELINTCSDMLNLTRSIRPSNREYDPNDYIAKQIIRTDTRFTVYRNRIVVEATRDGDDVFQQEHLRPFGSREDRFDLRTYSVRNFPQECTQSRMARTIGDLLNNQLRLVGTTMAGLFYRAETAPASKSTTELKVMRSDQATQSPFTKAFPSVVKKRDDWQAASVEIAEGGLLAQMGYFIASAAPDGEGERAERTLKAVYRAAGFTIERDDDLHMVTLLALIPLALTPGRFKDFKSLARLRTMTVGAVSRLAPMQGEFLGYAVPHNMLVGRRGQPFFWSPFANTDGNHNVAIMGASGSGKSVFMMQLATAQRAAGGLVFVIDSGESFRNACELQGGVYIKFSLDSGLCINPFSMADPDVAATDMEYLAEMKTDIGAIIKMMSRGDAGATQEEAGAIDDVVNLVWERKGQEGSVTDVRDALAGRMPYYASEEEYQAALAEANANNLHLSDLYKREVRIGGDDRPYIDYGTRGRDLATALSPFCEDGTYGSFFNGPANIVVDNPYTGFEMGPLDSKPELRAVVVLAVMFLIRERMRFGGRSLKKMVLIDEAWQLLGGGAAGQFIEGAARRWRKEGGSLVTGTQSPQDFYKTSGARACIQNSDWTCILRLKPETVAQAVNDGQLSLDETGRQLVLSLQTEAGRYSEVYIAGNSGRTVGRVVLDRFSAKLFSSTANDFEAIKAMKEEGLPVGEAVFRLAYPDGEPVDDDDYEVPSNEAGEAA